jgi:response regulator of citrate/malate metabolism
MLLNLYGIEVIGIADNGIKALEIYKKLLKKPDIILLDQRMPLKNGIETAKEILKLNKDSRIIFTSADVSVKEEALSLGIVEFIEKPFQFEILIDIIHKSLNPISIC